MRRLPEIDGIRAELEPWVEGMARNMGESATCLTLFTNNYAKGIDSLLQFAVAVMLDKPIYLMVERGTHLPEHVKKIAAAIEYCEPGDLDSMKRASERLIHIAQQKDFSA
jgi:hypothetical protein